MKCCVYNTSVVISVQFEQSTYRVDESNGIVQPVLVLSSLPAVDITVHVFTNDGSAVRDDDFKLERCDVTFQSGTNETTLNVTIIDDALLELDKNFILSINSSLLPKNVKVVEPSNTTVTILSDDGKY